MKSLMKRLNPEMLVGLSAVIIGVCALGVSLYETSLMREEQRAAVMPLLELARSYNLPGPDDPESRSRLLIHAENVGIGPALVQDFRVSVDGKNFETWGKAFGEIIGRTEEVLYGQSSINGRTIPPGRSVTMFELNNTELTREILAGFGRLDFEACFCSIFDECWKTSYSRFGTSEEVEECVQTTDSFAE